MNPRIVSRLNTHGTRHLRSSVARSFILATFVAPAMLMTLAGAAAAASYYVDNQNPAATDAGPGTQAIPYRTISAAVSQHGGAGTDVTVRPGVYREQVSLSASGVAGSAFVVHASGPGVIVEGSDDLGGTGLWATVAGNVFRSTTVAWAPGQVFADGQRLAIDTTLTPASSLPSRTFRYVPGLGLYVNAGGGNPGAHGTLVGHRPYGFTISGRSYVVLAGFDVRHSDNKAIEISNLSSNCEIRENSVSSSRLYGIQVAGGSNFSILRNRVFNNGDHGIALTNGATGSTLAGNECYRNARVTARAANGINLFGAPGNRIERNLLHDNQDTGLQFTAGSNGCVSVLNRSWNNGDHGFDHLTSANVAHVCDVAYGNVNDGFSFEGNSPGGQVHDCIAVDNGLATNEFGLWVDGASSVGFASDYNLIWNHTAQVPIKFVTTQYATMAAFNAVTGQEAHGVQAEPRFVNAAPGDFHLLAGSPAIDAGSSAPVGWPALDAEGHTRVDDPATPNRGAGAVGYSDIGALEYAPSTGGGVLPPLAELRVRPPLGAAPLAVVADASESRDFDGRIVSYRFDFGDGTVLPAQAQPTATHTYAAGTWKPQVTVTDNDGHVALAGALVIAAKLGGIPPLAVLTAKPALGFAPLAATLDASLSHDFDGSIVSYTFDFGDGTGAGPQTSPSATHTYGTGAWTPHVTVKDNSGLTGSAAFPVVALPRGDRTPIVTVASRMQVDEAHGLAVHVSAFDPDSQVIASLTADVSGLPKGSDARFSVDGADTAGTFRWTPTYDDSGSYVVRFHAANARTGSAAMLIHVSNVDRAPELSAPNNLFAAPGSILTIRVTAQDPDGDAIQQLDMQPFHMPANSGAVFVANATRTGGTLTWPLGGFAGNFKLMFHAANKLSSTVSTNIHVKSKGGFDSQQPMDGIPATLALSPGFPNPSDATVDFALDLPQDARVAWAVFDLAGRMLWSEDRTMGAGRTSLRWDGIDRGGVRARAGVYLARVRVNGTEFTRRLVRL